MNSSKDVSGVSDSEAVATETIVRLLEDAIKDVQRRNSVEIADANIINDVINYRFTQSSIPEVYVE